MDIVDASTTTLVDGHLANSIIDAVGVPRHLAHASITLAKYEEALLERCIEDKDLEHISHILDNNNQALNLCLAKKKWCVGGLSGVFPGGLHQPRLLEVMLFVAIDVNNTTLAAGIIDLFVELKERIAVVFLERLLATACKRGAGEIVKLLVATFEYYPDSCTSALISFVNGLRLGAEIDLDTRHAIQLVIEAGGDVNASQPPDRYSHGFLLQQAVFRKSLDTINLFIRNGAKMEQSGALQAAVSIDYIDGLDLLLQRGADVNELLEERIRSTPDRQILSRANESALTYAVRCDSSNAVSWLLANSADPNSFRETSLMRLHEDRCRMVLAENIWDKKRKQHRDRRNILKHKKISNGETLIGCWDELTISRGINDEAKETQAVHTQTATMEEWESFPQKFKFKITPSMNALPESRNDDR